MSEEYIPAHYIEKLATEGTTSSFAVLVKGRCVECINFFYGLCEQEHPGWFTPKRKLPSAKHWKDIEAYLLRHVPSKHLFAVEVSTSEGCDDSSTELQGVCKDHLEQAFLKLKAEVEKGWR